MRGLTVLVFFAVMFVQARGLFRASALRPKGFMQLKLSSDARASSQGLSLDVALIASKPDLVIQHLSARRASESVVEQVKRISVLREERNAKIVEGDAAKNSRKTLSQEIGKLMKEGKADEATEMKEKVAKVSEISSACDESLGTIDAEINSIVSCIPNLLDDSVPDGMDDSDNVEVRTWGTENRKMGEDGKYLWHDELATNIGGIDIEAAARISGARFSILVGPLARLERAIQQFFLDFHTERGYKEVSVPYIVSRSTLEGTGQLPKFEDDLFKVSHMVAGEDAFLIPTAEVPVTSMVRGQLLEASDLPMHYVCASPSFRAEAGSYGRDTRGLLRQHQFHKVELVKIVTGETSEEEHQKMVEDAQAVLEALEIPYRTVLLCSGDIGFSARKCYDIEAWLPGQQAYKEISSVSNCCDFQARRMSLRYRNVPKGSEKVKGAKSTSYPHTLNGSGVAVGRALVAILENYQNPDGSVTIPRALRRYMGDKETLEKVL